MTLAKKELETHLNKNRPENFGAAAFYNPNHFTRRTELNFCFSSSIASGGA
jgi:hypothetical protein